MIEKESPQFTELMSVESIIKVGTKTSLISIPSSPF